MRFVISRISLVSSISSGVMILKFGEDGGIDLSATGVECAICTAINNFEPSCTKFHDHSCETHSIKLFEFEFEFAMFLDVPFRSSLIDCFPILIDCAQCGLIGFNVVR